MDFKFYESETIKLPDGNDFEIIPFTVEDLPLVVELMDARKEVSKKQVKDSKKRKKKEDEEEGMGELAKHNMQYLFPPAFKLTQRTIKRQTVAEYDTPIKELDQLPDVPIKMNLALQIAVKCISVSMKDEDDTKKQTSENQAATKS